MGTGPAHPDQTAIWEHAIARARLGVWDWDFRTDSCVYSDSWFQMLGYAPGELPQRSDLWLSLTHPDDRERAVHSGDLHISGSTESIETELRLRHKDGHWIWVLDRGGIIERDETGRPVRLVGVQTDISPQKAVESELHQANQRVRLALEASDIGIWQFDFETGRTLWDARTRTIYGLEPIIGDQPSDLWKQMVHPEDRARTEKAHSLEHMEQGTLRMRYRIIRSDGELRHVETLAKLFPVLGSKGRLIGTIRDVTEEEERQRQLDWAAKHDDLTGLFNRAAFEALLRTKIASADTAPFAIFYIDLDYFKALNDSAGHSAGDAALKRIGQSLRAILPNACLARLGGDEFAILHDLGEGEPEAIADRILASVRRVGTKGGFGHTQLGASIGITVIRDQQTSPDDALARADDACYAAKSRGRNRWSTFSPDATVSSGLTAARLVADLVDAKSEGRLELYGQEIRRLNVAFVPSARIEVLARLFTRQGQIISPAEFIPATERFGMASALDRWIVQTALAKFGSALAGSGDISLSFNLSAQTLSDPLLWDFIEAACAEAKVLPKSLVFEITETAAFTNMRAAERFVRKARKAGFKISLDDFGSGLSSFSYLRRFPVDSIKIDGSFIENLKTSRFDREVVRAISEIAGSLGYDVIAERIEDEATLEILHDLQIPLGQGFLMHRPEPLGDIIARFVGTRDQMRTGV